MQEPTLVIMAAGMGSRFGGLKQITPVDDQGRAIIDYSLYDAYRSGFRRVAFIIKHDIERDFRLAVGSLAEKLFNVQYVFQEIDRLPEGFSLPEGRTKPWGTGHAVACCRGVVDGPFAVINADDFYGAGGFRAIYDFLASPHTSGEYAMVGYRLRNTVTDSGYVSRGICTVENGLLTDVTERTHIEKRDGGIAWTEDGEHYTPISGDETVSMNFWGFGVEMLDRLWDGFPPFLRTCLEENPLKGEYFLPSVVNRLLQEGRALVRVLHCDEAWHGVTYREDVQQLRSAIQEMKNSGIYPQELP